MLRLPIRLLPRLALGHPTAAAHLPRLKSTTTTTTTANATPAVSDAASADPAPVPTSREIIAEKSKLLEGKYAAALKRKMEAEGLESLEALKAKKLAAEQSALAAARERRAMSASTATAAGTAGSSLKGTYVPPVPKASSSSPIAPLGSILNLPALLSTPHPFAILSQVWETLHASLALAHPSRFLSATIPSAVYASMLETARQTPQMIVPLPRGDGEEFFFLQWQFYEGGQSTVVFTSLGEYKLKGEWARPFLSITHWTDLAEPTDPEPEHQGAVFMRAEITSTAPPKPAKLPAGVAPPADVKERFLLSPADAQLLLLGLQRFYHLASGDASDREQRRDLVARFAKGDWSEADWRGLSKLAVGKLKGIL